MSANLPERTETSFNKINDVLKLIGFRDISETYIWFEVISEPLTDFSSHIILVLNDLGRENRYTGIYTELVGEEFERNNL